MLNINLTLLVQLGLFLIYAVLLNQVFFKPVTRVLTERKEHIDRQTAMATDALKQVQELQANYDAKLKGAHASAQEAIQAAIGEADTKRHALIDAVKLDISKEVDSARQSIQAERATALATLAGDVGQFSEAIKRKVLSGSPAYSGTGGSDA
jgi:F-type H+-transporting ATPase subunit b